MEHYFQALYHMLVMMTPSPASSERARVTVKRLISVCPNTIFVLQKDPILLSIQKDLQLLLYRYLCFQAETKSVASSSKELDVSLMGLSQVRENNYLLSSWSVSWSHNGAYKCNLIYSWICCSLGVEQARQKISTYTSDIKKVVHA